MKGDGGAPLCAVCQGMLRTISNPGNWSRGTDPSLRLAKGIHHATVANLTRSSQWGCGLCARLAERLERAGVVTLQCHRPTRDPWLRYTGTIRAYVDTVAIEIEYAPGKSLPFDFLLAPKAESAVKHPFRCFSESTGDAAAILKASLWLEDCIANHSSCSEGATGEYHPPRLLQLEGGCVRLIETSAVQPTGPYATLSYCWGRDPKHLTLTSNNMSVFSAGLQVSQLARTFREAIKITQSLGVRFLWIDAMCILQSGAGHAEDWERHVTEMGTIYDRCLFNIAVDHGTSAESGCFQARNPAHIKPCLWETPSFPYGATFDISGSRVLSDTRFWSDLVFSTPLMSRGWVLQERLLSRRVLHLGGKQVAWECQELLACETFPSGTTWSNFKDNYKAFSLHSGFPDVWTSLVQTYSSTQLTNPKDKLPAIAGVATRVASKAGSDYAAGLMVKDLPQSLLWRYSEGRTGEPVVPYRAPSWSWASRENTIGYPRFTVGIDLAEFAAIQGLSLTHADSTNPFGSVESGVMTIIAPTFAFSSTFDDEQFWSHRLIPQQNDLRWTYKHDVEPSQNMSPALRDDFSNTHLLFEDRLNDGCELCGVLHLDQPKQSLSSVQLTLMFVLAEENNYPLEDGDPIKFHGLIITPARHTAGPTFQWERNGTFTADLYPPTPEQCLPRESHLWLKSCDKVPIELI